MSYTRILVRRGTSTEWTTANPILAAGEFGFETNTGKFKVGNGTSNWAALKYFLNFDDIKTAIVDSAPTALDTLNELAEALNDDENFAATVLGSLDDKAPLDSPTFTGTVDMSGATLSGVMLPINWMGVFSDLETYAENDMVHWNGSVYYATGPNLNNSNGYYPTAPGADWELFASKGDSGADGEAATVDVGNSYYPYTGPEGSFVVNTGTTSAAVLDFYLAPGPAGADGADGGFDSTQVIESVSTSRSLSSSDAGKLLTNSGAVTITVTGLSVGQQVDFIQTNSSQITFVAGSGVTLYSKDSKLKTNAQYSAATIKCIATDTYVLVGDLGA